MDIHVPCVCLVFFVGVSLPLFLVSRLLHMHMPNVTPLRGEGGLVHTHGFPIYNFTPGICQTLKLLLYPVFEPPNAVDITRSYFFLLQED